MISDTARIKTHRTRKSGARLVKAVHGLRTAEPAPQFELDMAAHLKGQLTRGGSEHTGSPAGVPLIQSDLKIAPVRICAGADIGVNSIILPGVTVGREAIVGAGAVLTKGVPDFATVAGVPARVIDWRKP
jgi:acetyltransferase-like isoleucine patch superfamily enzyme